MLVQCRPGKLPLFRRSARLLGAPAELKVRLLSRGLTVCESWQVSHTICLPAIASDGDAHLAWQHRRLQGEARQIVPHRVFEIKTATRL